MPTAQTSGPFTWRSLLLAGLPAAVLLALAMALVSAPDAHPDELYHLRALEFYKDHWLPPKVGDPRTLSSYSQFGASYLADFDPSYLVAGKAAALGGVLGLDALHAARLAAVLMLALLAGAALRLRGRELYFAVLLLSPQIWYVFSYANNDALPLAAAFAFFLLVHERDAPLSPLRAAGATLALALLLLAKLNFLLAALFAAAYLLARSGGWVAAGMVVTGLLPALLASRVVMFVGPLVYGGAVLSALGCFLLLRRAPHAWRSLALIGAALLAFGAMRAYVLVINDGPHGMTRALQAVGEKTVQHDFRPRDRQAGAPAQVHRQRMRDQGIGFHEIFLAPWHWAQATAATSAGLYGYMKARAPFAYYLAFFALAALFAALVLRALAAGPPRPDPWLPWMAALFCTAVFLQAAYHSWVSDFQPQGRYLFPALPAIGLVLHACRAQLEDRRAIAVAAALLALGVYSFAVVGIAGLPSA